MGQGVRNLCADRRGTTLVEFGMIAPVMLLLLMGLGELTYTVYAKSILDGAIQKAARDSAIQGGGDRAGAIDERVMEQVRTVAGSATYRSFRHSYHNFTSVKPERFTDSNRNGVRDPGECFDDINGNSRWDADPGLENQGGASDVTRYRIEVTMPRVFPLATMLGWSPNQILVGETLLKNQPFAAQSGQTVREVCK